MQLGQTQLGLQPARRLRSNPLITAPCAPCAVIRRSLACANNSSISGHKSNYQNIKRRVVVADAAGSSISNDQATQSTDGSISFKKGFWTFIDVVAIFGSVGGALAAILNLFAGNSYILLLPLVLPVVSLVAALQREGLIAEASEGATSTQAWKHEAHTACARCMHDGHAWLCARASPSRARCHSSIQGIAGVPHAHTPTAPGATQQASTEAKAVCVRACLLLMYRTTGGSTTG